MSTVTVGNIHFESTANNRITYSANSITMSVGGANVFTANSTQFNILVTANVTPSIQTTTGTITANTIAINSNGNIQVYGQYVLNGTVTPAVINANTSAWAPGITNTSIVRFSANSSVNLPISIYGMTAGTNGQVVVLSNIGTKVVRIASEDLANETTAGNRFNLPNDVFLNGYQSLSVYYDGTAARWKPVDNILSSWFLNATKGFTIGGLTGPGFASIACKTTYSTETTSAVPSGALSLARAGPSGSGNPCIQFTQGGFTSGGTNQSTADKMPYSSETNSAVPGANLTTVRSRPASISSPIESKIFILGGLTPGFSATTCRTSILSETSAAVAGANLTSARMNVKGIGISNKGYVGGGNDGAGTVVATMCRVTYSSETTALVPGAPLNQARNGSATFGNQQKGFFQAGSLNCVTFYSTSCKITYATETTSSSPGTADSARGRLAGVSSFNVGFALGGQVGGTVATTIASKINLTNESYSLVPGANLTQARYQINGYT